MKGKIAGIGTHRELLKNCEVYQQIAASQLSEAELNAGKNAEAAGARSEAEDGRITEADGKEAVSHA